MNRYVFLAACASVLWAQDVQRFADLRVRTVATLPSAAANTNRVFLVRDGLTATDCTTGGGSYRVTCASNGSAYAATAGGGSGSGDASTNTSSSVDSEVALFSGTGGKTIKRAGTTGIAKLTSGVLSAAAAGTDYVAPAGNVATATALAANGTNCSAGSYARGVDASGNAENCTAVAVGATSMGWWPIGPFTSGSGGQLSGDATTLICHFFAQKVPATSTGVRFRVTTSSGTGCTGGTCGFKVGIYDTNKTLIASTEAATSGNGTATKSLTDTTTSNGDKFIAWSTGSAVSGGTLTLAGGTNYYACYGTDSTALFLLTWGNQTFEVIENWTDADKHGYKSGVLTGNGASLALPASWSGTLTFSGGGAETAALYFVR